MNAETICHAAIGVLAERGRCYGHFELGRQVCVLGALAVAGGVEPEHWWTLQDTPLSELTDTDLALITAARRLAEVVASSAVEPDLGDLIAVVGEWHDGERHRGDVKPLNSEVFEALVKAAHLAGQARASAEPAKWLTITEAARRLGVTGGEVEALAARGLLHRRFLGDHFSISEESVSAYVASELAACEGDVLAEHATRPSWRGGPELDEETREQIRRDQADDDNDTPNDEGDVTP